MNFYHAKYLLPISTVYNMNFINELNGSSSKEKFYLLLLYFYLLMHAFYSTLVRTFIAVMILNIFQDFRLIFFGFSNIYIAFLFDYIVS